MNELVCSIKIKRDKRVTLSFNIPISEFLIKKFNFGINLGNYSDVIEKMMPETPGMANPEEVFTSLKKNKKFSIEELMYHLKKSESDIIEKIPLLRKIKEVKGIKNISIPNKFEFKFTINKTLHFEDVIAKAFFAVWQHTKTTNFCIQEAELFDCMRNYNWENFSKNIENS